MNFDGLISLRQLIILSSTLNLRLSLGFQPKEEDGEAEDGGEGDADVTDAHREPCCFSADLLVEGLQIPENGDAEEENAADVKEHSHFGFAVSVEYAKYGGVDSQGRY